MSQIQCGPNQFTCDQICLEISRKCDKIRDCLDRSDEENCGYSSVVLSDLDRIAQLGLVISIVVIALVLLIVLTVVLVVCLRRMKKRDLSSVEVIQVPSQYIKTQEGLHSSVASTASGPAYSNIYYGNTQQQQQGAPRAYNDSDQQAVLASTASAVARSHRCSSRRSNRSRRSTSSSRHQHGQHVAQGSAALAQSPTALTGSTTVSTSGIFQTRPSSVYSANQRREVSIAAPHRHSIHGNAVQNQQTSVNSSNNAAAQALANGFETSPPPPYSTFDRTVFAGQVENQADVNEPSNQQLAQSTPLFSATASNGRQILNRIEQNTLDDAANNMSQSTLISNALSCHQRRACQSSVSPYTREWIERVNSSQNQSVQPVAGNAIAPSDDTWRAEQSYAQQIRQALKKKQNKPASANVTNVPPPVSVSSSPSSIPSVPSVVAQRSTTPQYSQIQRRPAHIVSSKSQQPVALNV